MKNCKGQSDSDIISTPASLGGASLAYLSELERSCEPQNQALGRLWFQLETLQSKQGEFFFFLIRKELMVIFCWAQE